MIQTIATDAIVLAAALWLVWSFGPRSLRTLVTRKRAAPSYDTALQGDELAGQAPGDCGCEEKGRH